jgi:hypothetical protein
VILAVALDTGGAAAARAFAEAGSLDDVPQALQRIMGWDDQLWSRARRPEFPCLLPMAVWIDEQGGIVRPPECAGAFDGLRQLDLATFSLPDDVAARGRAVRRHYVDAVRDWVRKGSGSVYALSPEEVAGRLEHSSESDSLAAAHFQIGAYLYRHGETGAAQPFLGEAARLRPDAWTFLRQKIAVSSEEAVGGFAATPEYWEAVSGLGDRPYYPPIDMPGMPR